jgi:predicted GNAT superfamily acetyltransferase
MAMACLAQARQNGEILILCAGVKRVRMQRTMGEPIGSTKEREIAHRANDGESAMYTIRTLTRKADIDPLETLQENIWGYARRPESPLPYPSRCLFEFAESGGLVAGAYSDESELIGFSAAWLGRERADERRLYLHSQLVGIHQSWRDHGLGKDLKLHQRQFALEENLTLVKWTFDPLQSRNANLNLRKLGGIVRHFAPDYYGDLRGKMNQGFPTDRFWVEWYINSARVQAKLLGRHSPFVVDHSVTVDDVDGPNDKRRCISTRLDLQGPYLFIEIPSNILDLRTKEPSLALHWQMSCREMFARYLARYLVVDFIQEAGRMFYVLQKGELSHVLDDPCE